MAETLLPERNRIIDEAKAEKDRVIAEAEAKYDEIRNAELTKYFKAMEVLEEKRNNIIDLSIKNLFAELRNFQESM